MTFEDRFWAKVEEAPNGCWLWTACVTGKGYGQFDKLKSHRVAYELVVGKIPDGLQIDHLCRNRICVNPAHLEVVTCRENLLRSDKTLAGINSRKTHCVHGHPLSGDNLIRDGRRRICRTCSRSRSQERKAA